MRRGFLSVNYKSVPNSVLALLLTGVALFPTKPAAAHILPGHIPNAVRSARLLGRCAATEPVSLAIALPVRNQSELNNLLGRLYDPTDPLYGAYLTPGEFTSEFSPTEADYAAVASFAEAHGLVVTSRHSNRLLLDVAGPAHAVDAAFGVQLTRYQRPDGRDFRAPDRNPTIPDSLDSCIVGVAGLDNAETVHTHARPLALSPAAAPRQVGSGPGYALSPSDIGNLYNLNGPSIPKGSGQTLAVFELTGYNPSDVSAYESYFYLPTVPLQNVLVDGFNGAPGSGADEVTLDIELQIALAPAASEIMVYEGPNSFAGLLDTYNRIATDDQAKEISSSWGLSEALAGSSVLASENSIFQQMAAQGQSLFAASGDSGAYDNGSTLSVDDPSSQPYVVGVGGTQLVVNYGGSYNHETTWNNGSISAGAGGGGVSAFWSTPSWQQGIGSCASSTMRNVPDVSLDADPYTGYAIYYNNAWTIYGGTSCAAPLWSAFAALVNQQRQAAGETLLGFADPAIYQAGAANAAADFHDIADGSTNLYYAAVGGCDDATGWGSFNGANLLADLTAVTGGPAPPPTVPQAPTGLTATAGNGQVSLSWAASSGASIYYVGRSSGGGAYTTIASPTTTGYTDTSVSNGVTYTYAVSAANSAGESAASAPASATPQAPAILVAPGGLSAVAVSRSRINLSWTNYATGATAILVERSTNDVNFTQIASLSPSAKTYASAGLSRRTTYYYRLRAASSTGDSSYSNTASATTPKH